MRRKFTYGTAHFKSRNHALYYYGAGMNAHAVDVSIREGLVHIGEPQVARDETYDWDDDGRAIITVWDVTDATLKQ